MCLIRMYTRMSQVEIDEAVEKLKEKYLARSDKFSSSSNGSSEKLSPLSCSYRETYPDYKTACKNNRTERHQSGESESETSGMGPACMQDMNPPFNESRNCGSCAINAISPSGGERRKLYTTLRGSSPRIRQVYQEMLVIYDKLQCERVQQQRRDVQLQQREQQLHEREQLLLNRQGTLHKIQEVETELRNRVHGMQEHHQQELQQLSETLKERNKENKRIKSSFESMKELNDDLKKQLSDVSEQNKRMEAQSRKLQARLENLQRKYEYSAAQKGRENIIPRANEPKQVKLDKPAVLCKSTKVFSHNFKLLIQMLDWVADSCLVPPGEADTRQLLCHTLPAESSTQEQCCKVLPQLLEQLQQVPVVDPSQQVPLLRFIYWSLRQLDGSTQHAILSSTLRRLGEEMYRGVVPQPTTFDPCAPTRARASAFFKSSCLHTRFLATLILLKTLTQVDTLAQALRSLHDDLKSDEGRAFFLLYHALLVVLGHLKSGNRSLMVLVVDILMQMSRSSLYVLDTFLEACSTEEFFLTMSLLLRKPRLELQLLEKITILLQKLSQIRKNKRLFELFSLHLQLQEMHRTANPAQTFLMVNLTSILFHLGMSKKPFSPSTGDIM